MVPGLDVMQCAAHIPRLALGLTFLATVSACSVEPRHSTDMAEHAATRPNIVILFADDLGYGDLGVQGSLEVATPNIDQLAGQGVRLTNNYANHPVCSPSRAGLLTGKYQQRFGFENNPPSQGPNSGAGVPVSELMLAERLKAAGYATGIFGKWHIGAAPDKVPTARGFDTFYGFLSGAMAYTPEGPTGTKFLLRGTERVDMPAHTTEAFADEAIAFIEENRHQPFFVYVPFNAVHAPMQSTQEYLDRFDSETDPTRRAYLAMVAALDDAVGEIVNAIDSNGLGDNTLVIFTSDNGGPTWQTTSANTPLNGVKATLLEGGIRVPAVFRWTGLLPAGKVVSSVTMGHDIAATSQAIAGVPVSADQDGVNLMPYLTGERAGNAHDKLYWRAGEQGAMRDHNWKLVKVGDEYHLFDLDNDIGERLDLSSTRPDQLASMKSDWHTWSSEMMEPAWDRPSGAMSRAQRTKALQNLIRDYVAGLPVDPRPLLYGGGPE